MRQTIRVDEDAEISPSSKESLFRLLLRCRREFSFLLMENQKGRKLRPITMDEVSTGSGSGVLNPRDG
jgi:hypothetical protein